AETPDALLLPLPVSEANQLHLGDTAIQGDRVSSAEAVLDSQNRAQWQVNVDFRGEGREQWAQLTGEAACHPVSDPKRRVAIVLDDQIISAPEVNPEIGCERSEERRVGTE